jgi:TDG/mug DNA glycosylase family protein
MPGRASLDAGRYYAHPRNAFWRIMADLLGFDPDDPYAERIRALLLARIALWDVLKSCVRKGSLDTRIERTTEVPNDFGTFFRGHDRIQRVYFNGAKAESLFVRHVHGMSELEASAYTRLPSTSPAHASMSFERKLDAWRVGLPWYDRGRHGT